MRVIVVSEFDAVLIIEEKSFVLDKGIQKLELDFEEDLSFFVYPTKEQLLPYGVKIKVYQKELNCDSPHIKFYQVSENSYEIRLKKFRISSFSLRGVYLKEISGMSLMLLEGETSLFVVKEKEDINTFEIEQSFKEVAFDVFDGVAYFVAICEEKKYICFFCPTSKSFFAYDSLSIKIDGGKFEIVQDVCSHAGHGKKIIIELKEGQVFVQQKELLYLNQKPVVVSNLKAVPFAFFESIKIGDYNLAKTYLSSQLKSSLSSEILQEYFGDFVEVLPYNFPTERGSAVSVLSKNSCKVFSFNFENGKISDIDFLKEYAIK